MKILFVGSLTEGQTSRMRMEVLRSLGHEIIPLSTQIYWDNAPMLSRRIQQSMSIGPIIEKINEELLSAAHRAKPDLLWAEKQEYFKPDSLRELSGNGIKLVHYTPDPYFSLSWKRTKYLDACLALYDCLITSKKYELEDYRKVNSQIVYMPLGFSETVHRPAFSDNARERAIYASDVSFVGGWEPRREEYLNELAVHVDCSLKIWGYGWSHVHDGLWTPRRWWAMRRNAGGEKFRIAAKPHLSKAVQGDEIYGDQYAWALSAAKINIGFLRKICPDQHTTRTFEIPACGSLLLADRSSEHSEFFREGTEADYFSSKEEMIDKVQFYLSNDNVRQRVARRGFNRCHSSGYAYRLILQNALAEIRALGTI